MVRFLRENWLWIAIPIAVVLALFLVLVATRSDHATAEFVYTIG